MDNLEDADGTVPLTLEAWIRAQQTDLNFVELLEGIEIREDATSGPLDQRSARPISNHHSAKLLC
jgi:hypothetical protein